MTNINVCIFAIRIDIIILKMSQLFIASLFSKTVAQSFTFHVKNSEIKIFLLMNLSIIIRIVL